MTDVFACARAQIYYNSKRKSLAQVKRESGCSHIINGYLFNGSFQPVGWTVIDGKVISRDAYQDWGISIGSDGKPQKVQSYFVFYYGCCTDAVCAEMRR